MNGRAATQVRLYECPHEAPKSAGPGVVWMGSHVGLRLAVCAACEAATGDSYINDFHVSWGEVIQEGSVRYHGQQLVYVRDVAVER